MRNAAQASPGGEVRLSWWGDGRELFMQVEDDGPGIAESHRGALFEPFFTTKAVGEAAAWAWLWPMGWSASAAGVSSWSTAGCRVRHFASRCH